jgi:hypothetical protein
LAALGSAGVGLVLAVVTVWRPGIHLSLVGYGAAALVAPGLVVLHRTRAQVAARSPWFSPRPALDRVAAMVISAVVTCCWHAWVLATEVARR